MIVTRLSPKLAMVRFSFISPSRMNMHLFIWLRLLIRNPLKLGARAPSDPGTSVGGLASLASLLGASSLINGGLSTVCAACMQQEQGSSFLNSLNAMPTVAGVRYTVIESVDDQVVTPYTNAFLPAASNVTNITVNKQCPLDLSDHLEIAADPVALADMLNALDPASPVKVPCLMVLPLTGPVGPVPSF